jgi:hypothetical protein
MHMYQEYDNRQKVSNRKRGIKWIVHNVMLVHHCDTSTPLARKQHCHSIILFF